MNTTPNNQSADGPQGHANHSDNPPPSEVLAAAIILEWLHHSRHSPRERSKWTEKATVILTLFVAIAAFWSAWIFQGQLTVAIRQAQDASDDARSTRRHLREQFRIARQQVQVAQDSANAIQGQTQITERAWLSISLTNIVESGNIVAPNKRFLMRVSVQNTGHTPALNVKVATFRKVIFIQNGKFVPPSFVFEASDFKQGGVITPQSTSFNDYPAFFDSATWQQVEQDTGRPFVYGEVTYDDVFGVHHWLRYCYSLVGGGAYSTCRYNNDIDKNTN